MKKTLRILLVICIVLSCLIGISIHQSKYNLKVSYYTITDQRFDSNVRIVQLSDLHNSVFGEDNETLISLVKEQSPDLILFTGDIVNGKEKSLEIAKNVVTNLTEIAPVYISLGNHELIYKQNYDVDLKELFANCGAKVFDFEYEDIEINGQKIRLGGIYGYCMPEKFLKTNEADVIECKFLSEFQDTDSYTILMTHMPSAWMQWEALDEWDIDCVFAGHVHGGQVIFPLIGGLYAPDYGFFPGKLEGVYDSGDHTKHLVLTTGLGSTESVPRINNIPEIVVTDIHG